MFCEWKLQSEVCRQAKHVWIVASPKQWLCGQFQRAGCKPSISGTKVSAVRWYLLRVRVPVRRRVFPCVFLRYFPHSLGSLLQWRGCSLLTLSPIQCNHCFPCLLFCSSCVGVHICIAQCTSSHGHSLRGFRAGPGRGRSRREGRKEGGIVLKAEANSIC